MIRKTITLLAILMMSSLALAATAAAASHVDNISLKKQGDHIELTVYADGPFTFTHFIEEAKAGKPYRIIVDLKGSLHKLPQFNFRDLPTDIISAIRTSQYKIKPDKVVRVVADVSRPVTYAVKQSEGRVTLVLAAPQEDEFQFWCAAPLSEAEKIKLALTEPEVEQTVKPATMSAHPDTEKKAKEEGTFNPPKDENKTVADNSNTKQEAPGEEQPAVESSDSGLSSKDRQDIKKKLAEVFDKKEEQQPVQHSDEDQTVYAEKPAPKKEEPVNKVTEKKTALPVKTEKKTDKTLSDSQAVSPVNPSAEEDTRPVPVRPGEQPAKQDSEQDEKSKDWKSEKELRNNPDRPPKVKGSLAAAFPKREVVRYRSYGRRDPFMPLVSKALSGYKSGELPDVETLRLVGILQGDANMALLEDMEGYGYILEDGDQIKNGYVIQIYENKILFQISEFGWSRSVALTMDLED